MRHGLRSVIVGWVLAGAAALPTSAEPTTRAVVVPPADEAAAKALLQRMQTERDDIAFTGIRVLRRYVPTDEPDPEQPRVKVVETLDRWIHASGKAWRSERLKDGAAAPVSVTLRSGPFSFRRTGRGPWYQAALPPPRPDLADLTLALRNYRPEPAGTEEVAGRPAVQIRLRPRRPKRPSLILSLDAENRFRLRVRRLNADGALVSDHFYRQIRFTVDPEDGRFEPPPEASVVRAPTRAHGVQAADVGDQVDFSVLLPAWVPEGFRPTAARVSTFHIRDARGKMVPHSWVQLGYGDGVTTISLFQVRKRPPPGFTEPHQIGRQRDVWVLTGFRDGIRVTLMGEIGREDLIRMLSSVGASRRASRTQPNAAGP